MNAARDELKGTLASLDADLEDLDESVRVVENVGGMYGIDEEEIRSRRKFVKEVKQKVEVGPGCLIAPFATGIRDRGSERWLEQASM